MAFVLERRRKDAEIFVDDRVATRKQAKIYAAPQWVDDGTGEFVVSKLASRDGALELRAAAVCLETHNGEIYLYDVKAGIRGREPVQKIVTVEGVVAGRNVQVPLDHAETSTPSAHAVRWTYAGAAGTLVVALDIVPGKSKWTYSFTAALPGDYRIAVDYRSERAAKEVYALTRGRNSGVPYGVLFNGIFLVWRDMIRDDVFDGISETDNAIKIRSTASTLARGGVLLVDPSVAPDAGWSADISSSTKSPNDGYGDYVGHYFGTNYRVAIVFSLSGITAGSNITSVTLQANVVNTVGGSVTVYIGGYNGDGNGDPASDSASVAFSRCNVSGDNYGSFADFASTGSHTVTLGASETDQACIDAEALIGSNFVVAVQGTAEAYPTASSGFDEYTGSDPPTLTVNYDEPAAGGRRLMVVT